MKNSLSVAKLKFMDCLKAMGIFYSISLLLMILTWFLSVKERGGGYNNESAALIFLFVCGLNSFKESFKFTSANGVSRKRYFRESLIAMAGIAALATLVETGLRLISQVFTRHEMLYNMLYESNSIIAVVAWTFALFFCVSLLGWLINLIYYRSSALLKIVVSLSPVYVTILLIWLNKLIGGSVFIAIGNFISFYWGITDSNSYVAVLNLLATSVFFCGLIFLLMRRAPVKE